MLREAFLAGSIGAATACVPIGRGDVSPYLTLERIARFDGVCDGTACYQFDAEHAHFTFESGLTVHDVLMQLEQLAQAPLPSTLCSRWQESPSLRWNKP